MHELHGGALRSVGSQGSTSCQHHGTSALPTMPSDGEKARLIITKIPAIVDKLMSRTLAWESERKKSFLYDGARLVAVLEEHKQARLRQEEERRRLREQKKLRTLLSEKEAMPHMKRPGSSFGRTTEPCVANLKRVDADRHASSSALSVRIGVSSSGSSGGATSSSGHGPL